ncbi:MAG: 2Fe-2S iron-sulfur cluster-binding protein [Oculatellaceae cyanobacterium bins.114]|nr:2Fe-2S iron-sulfur cluster-binding protein [Oculatellaceae cyanobacterium bins.114]
MPKVAAQGKIIDCSNGANLRQVLLQNGIELHNGQSSWINCRGIGTCGTCAVQIEGTVSEPNWRDTTRRSMPPHSLMQNRRLACQTQVLGDVKITKFDGFWGHGNQPLWTAEG